MVALRAWYDIDDDNEPIIVSSVADIDVLLDRMIADQDPELLPPLLQFVRREPKVWAVLFIGVNGDRGILTHSSAAGGFVSTDGTSPDGAVLPYDYMGHLRELPSNAEVPLVDVREAVHEFVVTNGARSPRIAWQSGDEC